jgi:hypothetical protein
VHEVRALWDQDLPNEDWVIRFLKAVGSDPDVLTIELIAAAVPLVPVLRRGRPFWDSDLPRRSWRRRPFPSLLYQVDTAQGSTRCATISPNASVRLARWRPVPAMSSSSPGGL